MKIIILVRILWTAGAQKIAIREARELEALGNQVELVFLRGKKLPEYDELLEGIDYKIISETGNSIFSPLYQYITHKFMPDRGVETRVDYNLIRYFPKYIKNKKVDYIICHDQLAGLAGYYTFKKLGVKYSVIIHERLSFNSSILGKMWQKYEHKVLEKAIDVFTITEKIADSVQKIQNVKANANYPGMDVQRTTEFFKKENSLIAVAMWDYGRKPELYLDIIEKVPDFILYFVGNFRIKELENEFKDEIKKRKLEKKVIMKQGITESTLIKLYQKSKFVIRFGFGEFGLGTATIEAMQNCVPLIINSELGTAGLVNRYSCGLVLNDIATNTINRFIDENNNENSYKILQDNIVKLSNNYSWRKHAERLLVPLSSSK